MIAEVFVSPYYQAAVVILSGHRASSLYNDISLQVPEEAADPAKDPNNQGEDEFEEAEIDRPEFEERREVGKDAAYQKAEQKVLVRT